MDERILGTTIYMRSPAPLQSIPIATPWLKIDLERLDARQGIDFAALMDSGNSDPTQVLTYLDATSRTVVNLGHASTFGVATTHYHADIDLSKAMRVMVSRFPAGQRKAVRSTYRNLLQERRRRPLPDEPKGGRGQISPPDPHVRVRMRVAHASMDMTIELSPLGAPVHISPAGPPRRSPTSRRWPPAASEPLSR